MSSSNIITVSEAAAGYRRRPVFEGLDLAVRPGITALLGPNGAGKTTLLQMITGLHRTSAGSVSVLGTGMASRAGRRQVAGRIGYLPQRFGYLPGFTVGEFVGYAAWLKGMPGATAHRKVPNVLEEVGLAARSNDTLRSLSGGMLRRAGIASALVHDPELVILDEPASGLDPRQRLDLRELIVRRSRTSTFLLSTHLVEDVRALSTAVIVLDRGRVRFTGSPEDLAARGPGASTLSSELEAGYLCVVPAAA